MELKEEIALYESAAKLGVFLNDAGEKQRVSLGDSYVELGIKKITGTKPRFCRYWVILVERKILNPQEIMQVMCKKKVLLDQHLGLW